MRMLGENTTILSTNAPLHAAREAMPAWASDPTPKTNPETKTAFPGIDPMKDSTYDHLMRPGTNSDDVHVLLGRMCASAVVVMDRQLSDHFPGGKFWNPGNELEAQASSCSSTNISGEMAFAMSDRDQARAPNATVGFVEAKVMFRKNKTGDWLGQQEEGRVKEIITEARRCASSIREEDKEDEKEYERKLDEKLQQARRDVLKKEDKERDKMGSWLNELSVRKLCTSEDDVGSVLNIKGNMRKF